MPPPTELIEVSTNSVENKPCYEASQIFCSRWSYQEKLVYSVLSFSNAKHFNSGKCQVLTFAEKNLGGWVSVRNTSSESQILLSWYPAATFKVFLASPSTTADSENQNLKTHIFLEILNKRIFGWRLSGNTSLNFQYEDSSDIKECQ